MAASCSDLPALFDRPFSFLFQDLTSVVTCGQYQSCFDKTTLAEMNNCLNGGTHGPVHIKIGGEWNNPEQQLAIDLGAECHVVL